MLKRYDCVNAARFAYCHGCYGMREEELGDYVLYEDAEALQMRVIELEQKLKTQDELKAEFEEDCHLERVGGP